MEERMKAYYRKYKELVDAKADGDSGKTDKDTKRRHKESTASGTPYDI